MSRSILYPQYTNPANYPPLEHSGLILLQEGWDVHYFGIQSAGASNKLVFPATLIRCVTLWRHQPPGVRQKLHYIAYTLACVWRALWQRPAWVYCSDLMSCPAAWLIGRLTPCKVLYHEHDSPAPISDLRSPISLFERLLLWTRRRVGRGADLVILPNQKRLDLFVESTGRQQLSLCVFNCPRRDEVRPPKGEARLNGKLRLVFVGSINRDRLPMAVLEAMSLLKGQVQLVVIGYDTVGSQNFMSEFLQQAQDLGLQGDVEFLGALPRHKIFEPVVKCDVGLALFPVQGGDINMTNMTGASNKPFDYLACGLALLVSDLPDWKQMFVDPGYARCCQPNLVDSIAAQLRWFLDHPLETREMGERGRQRILGDWNYETQFAPVLQELGGASST